MSIVSREAGDSEHTVFMFKHETSMAEREQVIWLSLKQGNRKALDYIFERYVRLLYAYGNKITKDYGLVEDCIQDLFVELWNKHAVLSDTTSIKFYLMKSLRRRIERRLMVEHRLHLEQLNEQEYDECLDFSIEARIIHDQSSNEQTQQLTQAIEKLSKRQREAVYLKFYERMNYEEIAGIMNLTVKSAYKLIGKSIETLRETVSMVTLIG